MPRPNHTTQASRSFAVPTFHASPEELLESRATGRVGPGRLLATARIRMAAGRAAAMGQERPRADRPDPRSVTPATVRDRDRELSAASMRRARTALRDRMTAGHLAGEPEPIDERAWEEWSRSTEDNGMAESLAMLDRPERCRGPFLALFRLRVAAGA